MLERTDKFKFPLWAARLSLALSFVLSESISSRTVIFMLQTSPMSAMRLFTGMNFMLYLFVAAAYWGFVELIVNFAFKSIRQPREIRDEITKCFFVYFAISNICAFLFRLCYYWHPEMVVLGDILIAPSLYFIGFFAFFYYIVRREVLPKHSQGRFLTSSAMIFFGSNLFFTLFSLLGLGV